MGKAILPKGLTPSTRAGKAAGKLIDAKTDEVLAYIGSACAGEIEGLHDLRVAVKRLREGLRLFQRLLPPQERRKVLPLVEELNDGLGRVRDRDVLMAHARELGEAAPGAAPALEAALAAWEEQRQPEHRAAIELWERLAETDRLTAVLARAGEASGYQVDKLEAAATQAG